MASNTDTSRTRRFALTWAAIIAACIVPPALAFVTVTSGDDDASNIRAKETAELERADRAAAARLAEQYAWAAHLQGQAEAHGGTTASTNPIEAGNRAAQGGMWNGWRPRPRPTRSTAIRTTTSSFPVVGTCQCGEQSSTSDSLGLTITSPHVRIRTRASMATSPSRHLRDDRPAIRRRLMVVSTTEARLTANITTGTVG